MSVGRGRRRDSRPAVADYVRVAGVSAGHRSHHYFVNFEARDLRRTVSSSTAVVHCRALQVHEVVM